MKHRQIRRELSASIRKVLRKRTYSIVFRDYQRETLEATADWLDAPKGSRAAYVSHATGLGKTILFATLVSEADGLNCLVVVSSKLLVVQTVHEIVKLTNHAIGHVSSLGKIHGGEGDLMAMKGHDGQRIVVITEASFKRRAQELAEEFRPHVIIRDECHWSYTEKSQDAVELFPDAVVIGYSATPDYLTTTAKADYVPVTLENGQTLYVAPNRMAQAYYPTLLDRRGLRWGIENEYLAPLAWGLLEFDMSLDDVPVTQTPAGMDYDPEELRKAMSKLWPLMEEVIVRLYEDNVYSIRTRQVCAMCPGIAEAESLAKKIGRFVPSACITGSTDDEEREAVLTSFDEDVPTKDTIRFLSSVFVLREGWNSRNAEIALMLRPTKSRVLYEQFLGRFMRLRRDGREKIALALDAHFLRTRLAPLSAPVLYGVPGEYVSEGGILIGAKRSGRKITSPYLPKHIRPKLHIVDAAQIEFWAGDDGFFFADGEWWGSGKALARRLTVGNSAVQSRLSSCRSHWGRDSTGRGFPFYALKDVEKACADLLQDIPKSDEDGFFFADDEWWGTCKSLARRLKASESTLVPLLSSCRSRSGKDFKGHVRVFFALDDVKAALLAKRAKKKI